MDFEKFYDIAEYGNENWKGGFPPREIAKNAYDYFESYNNAKDPYADKTIFNLLNSLLEDVESGSTEALEYAKEIVRGLSN